MLWFAGLLFNITTTIIKKVSSDLNNTLLNIDELNFHINYLCTESALLFHTVSYINECVIKIILCPMSCSYLYKDLQNKELLVL